MRKLKTFAIVAERSSSNTRDLKLSVDVYRACGHILDRKPSYSVASSVRTLRSRKSAATAIQAPATALVSDSEDSDGPETPETKAEDKNIRAVQEVELLNLDDQDYGELESPKKTSVLYMYIPKPWRKMIEGQKAYQPIEDTWLATLQTWVRGTLKP